MNKFYSTSFLLCALLSLSACAVQPRTSQVQTDDKVDVLVEVKNPYFPDATKDVKVEVEVIHEDMPKEKPLYDSWEEYAPRKAYDETPSSPSYSDPAYTTAINPIAKPKVTKKVQIKPEPTPAKPIVKPENVVKPEEKVKIEVIEPAEGEDNQLETFNPVTSVIEEPTQEQLDAAKALLPPYITPPPPADKEEPLILRKGES